MLPVNERDILEIARTAGSAQFALADVADTSGAIDAMRYRAVFAMRAARAHAAQAHSALDVHGDCDAMGAVRPGAPAKNDRAYSSLRALGAADRHATQADACVSYIRRTRLNADAMLSNLISLELPEAQHHMTSARAASVAAAARRAVSEISDAESSASALVYAARAKVDRLLAATAAAVRAAPLKEVAVSK